LLDTKHSQNYQSLHLPYKGFQLTIAHNEPSLYMIHEIVFTSADARQLTLPLTTDGQQYVHGDTTAFAQWDGAVLVVSYRTRQKNTGKFVQFVRRMTISPDRQTITAVAEVTDDKGNRAPTSGSEVWARAQGSATSACTSCGR